MLLFLLISLLKGPGGEGLVMLSCQRKIDIKDNFSFFGRSSQSLDPRFKRFKLIENNP
jgi:hypothetical protein